MADEKLEKLIDALSAATAREAGQLSDALLARAADCVSLPRMRVALLRQDWTKAEREHIESRGGSGGCGYCQKTEKLMRAELWHPTLVELNQQLEESISLSAARAEDVVYHIEKDHCKRCSSLVKRLQMDPALVQLAKDLKKRPGVGVGAVVGDADMICAGDAFVSDLAVGANFADRVVDSIEFTCDGGTLNGVWRLRREENRSKNEHWIEIESQVHEAGTLVLLLLHNDDGSRAWTGFVMLREGYKRPNEAKSLSAVGRIRVTRLPNGETVPIACHMSADLLRAEDAALLMASFEAAKQDDHKALECWQTWAAQAVKEQGVNAEIRRALEGIASSEGPIT